jgi:hypothetical protein
MLDDDNPETEQLGIAKEAVRGILKLDINLPIRICISDPTTE